MDIETDPKINFELFKKTIADEIDSADSLDEIKERLKSQQSVESVELADHLLKSNPPQRDFIVEFKTEDGVKTKKIVNGDNVKFTGGTITNTPCSYPKGGGEPFPPIRFKTID